ncbi:MAG TPA: alpha/beta hydrolase [Polyangiaceae bacterium]|nr:alpha/beta hydrolase [Polyangiaceae bacterium]
MKETLHPFDDTDRSALATFRAAVQANSAPMTRASYDLQLERIPDAPGVSYASGSLGGVKGTWCTLAGARAGTTILYLHGGAFVLGSAHAYRHFVGQIAARSGVSAFVVDYRLAPEHPFPAASEDAHAALSALRGSEVVIAGDSAGGGLALTLLVESNNARAGVVLSPWTDLALGGDSIETRAREDFLLSRVVLAEAARQYLNHHDPRDSRVSPLFAASNRLPPLLMQVGSAEILLDDARQFAAIHPTASLEVWEGMPHVFQRNVGTLCTARAALDGIGRFLKEAIVA